MLRFMLIASLLLGTLSYGQNPPVVAVKEPASLVTLRALMGSMTTLRAQLDQQNAKAKTGDSDAVKEAAKKEAEAIQKRLDEVARDIESVATGVDEQPSDDVVLGKLDLAVELQDLLGPLMREIRQATEQPRVIERLRGEVAAHERRVEQAKQAVAATEAMIKSLPKAKDEPDAALRKVVLEAQARWKGKVSERQGNLEATRYRLTDALSKRTSVWQILTNGARTFFLTRGVNVLLAVLVFFAAFLGWRAMHQWMTKISPWHRAGGDRSIFARLLDVLYHAMALVIGIATALMVLYVRGDWLLLGLCLIALLALILAAKNGLPAHYSQARLLLNLGEVREGERVVVNGLPWQVRSLNMTTDLVNPALRHSVLRVPIAQIIPLSSRPIVHGDLWFPCEEEDWVQLADGTFGKVVALSAEFVRVVLLGGSQKTYGTAAFLTQNPLNYTGGFRLVAIVKVHPEHRDLAIQVIPDAIREAIHGGLLRMVEPTDVKNLEVEFRAVIPNALEFDVVADFDGRVAEKSPSLQRALQHYALESCNENGWKLGA